jgi:RNA polymerase sigma factor (sigma-70 family)
MASDPREPLHDLGDEALYARWHSDAPPPLRSAAWETLYNRHRDNLVAYCHSLTHDIAATEDHAEEAFVRLLVKPREVRQSFRAYLWKTARAIALDTHARLRQKGPIPKVTSTDLGPAEDCETAEVGRAIESCLASLNPHEREFLLLRACHDLSLEEAREVVGWTCAVSTCKSRYDKTLQALRRCLKNRGFSAEKTDLQTV